MYGFRAPQRSNAVSISVERSRLKSVLLEQRSLLSTIVAARAAYASQVLLMKE